jgi:N-acylglucosamine 2-epimerase
MNGQKARQLASSYRDELLEDNLPFWERHSIDEVCGGFLHCVDRDGSLVDSDKSVWIQGRAAWLFATLYHVVEPRPQWLSHARSGVEFLKRHCFDSDGRMFFWVTRDGAPLRKRRYFFSECFAAIAFAALARAANDNALADEARRLFLKIQDYRANPNLAGPPKWNRDIRPMKGIGSPMITLNVAQELRDSIGDDQADAVIDECIGEIEADFLKPDLGCVMETVGPGGSLVDHFDGRLLNPGHALEAAWFILREAIHRGGDPRLTRLGCCIVDWMWTRGWDAEYGGLYYFRDLFDGPVQEYWHEMKFWWPHNEALLATLMAHQLTGETRYEQMHDQLREWTCAHFRDPELGEWFGYLRRDGSLSSTLKGNLWKGPFHVPRMLLTAWRLLETAEP